MPARGKSTGIDGSHDAGLGQFCAAEAWSGNLDTGLFALKATTRQILGLGTGSGCGLLTLIDCFDPADRARLIDLFERVAGEPMRFSFATTIARHGKIGQAVFCIGRSERREPTGSGTLNGVFIFPHL